MVASLPSVQRSRVLRPLLQGDPAGRSGADLSREALLIAVATAGVVTGATHLR